MRYAISYVSTASGTLTSADIENLLRVTEKRNNNKGITGLLLFSEGNFFQIIEGDEDEIKSLFQKICDDERHANIIRLFETPIKKEAYDGYKTDKVPEGIGYSISKFETYSHYLQILEPQKQKAVKNLLKAFIR